MKIKVILTPEEQEYVKLMERVHKFKLKKVYIRKGIKVWKWTTQEGNYLEYLLDEIYGKEKTKTNRSG